METDISHISANVLANNALLAQINESNELLLALTEQNQQILLGIYTAILCTIGIVGAVFVCVLLYKFLRTFY